MEIKDLAGKIESIGKSMETNLKYQILTVGLFFAICLGTYTTNSISILGTDIPIDILLISCPVIFIYLLSRFAIDTSLFLVSNNLLIKKLNSSKIDKAEFRVYFPMSLFITIILGSEIMPNKKRRIVNKILSLIIFIIPGINIGIGFFILLDYMSKYYMILFWIFLIIGLIIYVIILLIISFKKSFIKYRYIPISVIIASILTLLVLYNTMSLNDVLKNNKEKTTQNSKFKNHY